MPAGVVIPPDDTEGMRAAIQAFASEWQRTRLPDLELPAGLERRISRTERVRELAEFLRELKPAARLESALS